MASQGIHHITAVAGSPKENFRFYTEVLGLRLVKKTVNFDDPTVYHLYYGNELGDPGTVLTFFPWEHTQQGEPGQGQVVAVAFSIPTHSKDFWLSHLKKNKVEIESPFKRFGKEIIGLKDPDGLHLELILDPKADSVDGWNGGAVSADYAIRGIHGATLAENNYSSTGKLVEEELGFELTNQLDNRFLYESNADFGSAIEIIDQFKTKGRPGKGTVHHIAFRAEDDHAQQQKRDELLAKGYHATEVKDRQYFESVYFYEPGGILFEIATDPPGFLIDEKPEGLGLSLKLPDWLKSQQDIINRDLPPLTN